MVDRSCQLENAVEQSAKKPAYWIAGTMMAFFVMIAAMEDV